MSVLNLSVAGLSCAGCIPSIERALLPLPAISRLSISLHDQPSRVSTVSLHLNAGAGEIHNVLAAVHAALPHQFSIVAGESGPDQVESVASTQSPAVQLALSIAGLSCSGCVPAVVNALDPLSLVSGATVSLHDQPNRVSTLSLQLTASDASTDDIVAAVRAALPKRFSIVSSLADTTNSLDDDVIRQDMPVIRRFRCGCGNNNCKCSMVPVLQGDTGVLVRVSSTESSNSSYSMSCYCTNADFGGPCMCTKKATMEQDVFLSILGMTCAACVSKVEGVLRALPGVKSASVALLTGRAALQVEPNVFESEVALEKLKTFGYDATDITQQAAGRDDVFLRFSDVETSIKAVNILRDSPWVTKVDLFNPDGDENASDEGRRTESRFCGLSSCGLGRSGRRMAPMVDSKHATGKFRLRASRKKTKQFPIVKISSHRKLNAVMLLDERSEDGDSFSYEVLPRNDPILTGTLEPSARLEKEAHQLRFLFIGAFICSAPVAFLTMLFARVDALGAEGLTTFVGGSGFRVVDIIALVLATPVQFVFGFRFYRGSWYSLKQRRANMDLLIALGTSIAYFFSVILLVLNTIQIKRGLEVTEDAVAFETSSLLITIVLFGKWMETIAKKKTTAGVESLTKLAPRGVILVSKPPSTQALHDEVVNVELVSIGDYFQVNPGAAFPLDGVIEMGQTTVDESMLTGESWPVTKRAGDTVYAGTVNGGKAVIARCTASDSDSMLAKIISLVKRAQETRAPIEAFSDKVSAIFVPFVLVIALMVTVTWFGLIQSGSIPGDWADGEGNVFFALLFGLSVLVISCPCAFGLATPTVVMVATSLGARKLGILYKDGGETLEAAHTIDTVLFDKTGTLTVGKPVVTCATVLHPSPDNPSLLTPPVAGIDADAALHADALRIIAAAESFSDHPLAQALTSYAASQTAAEVGGGTAGTAGLSDHELIAGRGITCRLANGAAVRIGEAEWATSTASPAVRLSAAAHGLLGRWERDGRTVVVGHIPGKATWAFGIEDRVRADSAATVRYLQARGVRCVLVTGDGAGAGLAVGRQVGIAAEDVHARMLPADKVRVVRAHSGVREAGAEAGAGMEEGRGGCGGGRGKGGGGAMFVGDGVNDAAALAAARVGVAVGGASQAAAERAGIVVMRDGVWEVAVALDLARKAFGRMRINYVWALGFNTVAIPLAGGALFPVLGRRIPPFVAAAAMGLSSLAVVASSLALARYTPPARGEVGRDGVA